MKIGFLILVHKNPDQLIRLANLLLQYEDTTLFIHVDLKSEGVFQTIKTQYGGNSRVVFSERRYKVFWGSYGQILATLSLMRAAYKSAIDYYCLISGQDLPSQPLPRFAAYLQQHTGTQFLSYQKLPTPEWVEGGYSRMNRFYLNSERFPRLINKLNAAINRLHTLTGFRRKIQGELYTGANWFNLSNDAMTYVLKFIERHPDYLKQFKYTQCADEIFVQSILLNSPFKDKIINNDLRLVDWDTGPEFPRTYRDSDFERIINNKDKFFARKFDEQVDHDIINRIINYHKQH